MYSSMYNNNLCIPKYNVNIDNLQHDNIIMYKNNDIDCTCRFFMLLFQ